MESFNVEKAMRNRGPSPESHAKRAETMAARKEARAESIRQFGKYSLGKLDEWNWAWWETDKNPTNPAYYFYPSFEWALRGLGTRLASDHAVRVGTDVKKWLSGCEKIAASIEKGLEKP